MFRLELGVEDLADARFTISPLHEAVNSLWPVYAGWAQAPHGTWAARVRAHPGIDHVLLGSLVSQRKKIPDFIAPPPRLSLADQLLQVRQTPPGKVVSDILAAYGSAPLPDCLRGIDDDPAALCGRVADALGRYWDLAIAPLWPRVIRLLEADVLHRGLALATGGPGEAFGGLDRRIRWDGDGIVVDIMASLREEIQVAGRGLRFVPCVFAPFPNLPIDVVDPPVLAYPARASATLWHAPPRPRGPARAVLGSARARLLAMLDEPASTTSLAGNLGVTPSAVSQQLRMLADAGLVAATRAGRVVLYQRTDIGTRLIRGTS